jgi:2-polyprenyl-3-methyl-5-hydroxy-6-metoxy-1,4-benzoquinol methylase
MSILCNVCATTISNPVFCPPGHTSLSSLGEIIQGKAEVYFCDDCGHLQTKEIQNIDDYYDKQYKILIDSEDEDQLYKIEEDRKIYRYDFQAETVLSKLNISQNANLLEYGAAKGATIRRVLDSRKDLSGYVFDVSEMYIPFWDDFILKSNQAKYTTPTEWIGSMDYVISFYVLEHVASLDQVMQDIWNLLKPSGKLYFIVPNTYENIADFVVADHINHFSTQSITRLMSKFGFSDVSIDNMTHDSAFIVTGTKSQLKQDITLSEDILTLKNEAEKIAKFWQNIVEKINRFELREESSRSAIYGAGFYGTFIFSHMEVPSNVSCFIDQNRHLQGKSVMGIPILAPEDMPLDIDTLYVGLNPKYAKKIISGVQVIADKKLNTLFL